MEINKIEQEAHENNSSEENPSEIISEADSPIDIPETDSPENDEPDATNLLHAQGTTYTKKSQKLEDARSSSWLFIVFGIVGLLLILVVWLDIIPLGMALYMRVLYTVVLGVLFVVFILVGIYYTRRIKTLRRESGREERQTKEIVTYITENYPLDAFDRMISADTLSMEQRYFERYEKIAALIREHFEIQDEAYLDYLIEKIYQIYSPED